MYFPLKIQRTLKCSDHQWTNGVHFRTVMIVESRGKALLYMEIPF